VFGIGVEHYFKRFMVLPVKKSVKRQAVNGRSGLPPSCQRRLLQRAQRDFVGAADDEVFVLALEEADTSGTWPALLFFVRVQLGDLTLAAENPRFPTAAFPC
jgi:hypothetical protein